MPTTVKDEGPTKGQGLTETEEQEQVTEQVLTLRERCDACGHRAYVMIRKVTEELPHVELGLSLCGHHYQANASELASAGWEVWVDERKALLARA